MLRSQAFPVSEVNQIGEARRVAEGITRDLGFSPHETGIAALIVTELGQNLVKYGQNGQLVLRKMNGADEGLEVLSLDSGPGMGDIPRSLSDGYSTSGTPGTGLGAVKRKSSLFDIYSAPSLGTAIVSRVLRAGSKPSRMPLEIGVVCVPLRGQNVCGDSWAVYQDAERAVIMLVDGLGHGPDAAEASGEAVKTFDRHSNLDVATILTNVHEALRSTRGAVVAAAEVELSTGKVQFSGVGNICSRIVEWSTSQHMVSLNGTAGLAAKFKVFDYDWARSGVLIMCSDGLTTHWRLSAFPGLIAAHPSLIAGILYQNFYRGRDDVTVMAARWNQN